MKDIRIATVIINSPVGRIDYNLEQTIKMIKEAKKRDVAVICFPEMHITGYSTGEDIRDYAEPVPGRTSQELLHWAVRENIVILAGLAEKSPDNRIFATHLVVKPDGVVEVYRKLHTSPPERNVFTSGSSMPLFETKEVRFGIQLCYDAHFPELSTQMALKGADIIFIPHASPQGTPQEKYQSWMRHLPARAYDNSTFVVACNQAGKNEKGLDFPGIALIVGPSGKVVAKDLSGKEGMLVADLEAGEMDRVRNNRMHFFLPHRRPELYCS